jgi:alkylhydroperoxidase/carboxymuconolactone decarboxylase family protein YurZ
MLDYTDRLRRLAINDSGFGETASGPARLQAEALDHKSLALVRIAALIAIGGAVPSYAPQADCALAAGATMAEIVDVLVAVVPVVGLPLVVAAAPKLALALGHDIEDDG